MVTLTERVVRRARNTYGVDVLRHKDYGSRARRIYALRRRVRTVRVMQADTLVGHITVTPPLDDFRQSCRDVEGIGTARFGSGMSYNVLFHHDSGQCAIGQPLDAKGTHTVNDKGRAGFTHDQNHAARAFAFAGVPGTRLGPKTLRAMAGFLAAMIDEGAMTSSPDLLPHSFFAFKDCPTDTFRDQLGDLWRLTVRLRAEAHDGKVTPKVKPPRRPTNVSLAAKLLRKAVGNAKAGTRRRKLLEALQVLPKR